jgi:hypothetical protein
MWECEVVHQKSVWRFLKKLYGGSSKKKTKTKQYCIGSSNPNPGYISERTESRIFKRYLHMLMEALLIIAKR